jgi:hypothetical protein
MISKTTDNKDKSNAADPSSASEKAGRQKIKQ